MFEIKKTEYVNKTFRLEKELVDELNLCATNNNISLNKLVEQCCKYALSNIKENSKSNEK